MNVFIKRSKQQLNIKQQKDTFIYEQKRNI